MKNKVKEIRTAVNSKVFKATMAVSAMMGGILSGYCDTTLDGSMGKFLEQMWKVLTFAGIIMAALGAASLVRTISSIASGEQAQPGALGKGLGMLIGGIALAALKTLLGTLGIQTTV